MLSTIIFGAFLALFAFLFNVSGNYSLQRTLSLKSRSDVCGFMITWLGFAAIPWFFALYGAAARFYSGFKCPVLFWADSYSGPFLMVVSAAAFALSYAAVSQAGRLAGRSEGEFQVKSQFPSFVRVDPDGKPIEVRGWIRNASSRVGDDLFYDHRTLRIVSTGDREHKFMFITAVYTPEGKEQ